MLKFVFFCRFQHFISHFHEGSAGIIILQIGNQVKSASTLPLKTDRGQVDQYQHQIHH